MQGQLFSQDFLTRGVLGTPPWQALDAAAFADFKATLQGILQKFDTDSVINEAQTEELLIGKTLAALGWGENTLPQVNLSATGRKDVPDRLLFASGEHKAAALGLPGAQPDLDIPSGDHALKLFLLFFGRPAFLPQDWDNAGRSFHAYPPTTAACSTAPACPCWNAPACPTRCWRCCRCWTKNNRQPRSRRSVRTSNPASSSAATISAAAAISQKARGECSAAQGPMPR
jgi:hypothetical protein